ncbi:hypothetical protein NPS53_08810 [Pseudomonas putida]|uniref:hypothetical protein n=1 Tax=Pseudomonas putida TaxID=303 RepID=UPI0023642155|nr:hypothetical protein [Pseudomonas putida]MDD2139674.1 hypothetical protein [Pseudomonas putida]HDS1721598.1 hypothetical protein [Pseudomonas putida]
MDDLSNQIFYGLPHDWAPVPTAVVLPENTTSIFSASNGGRRIMFLRVRGPLTSAMPLFDANVVLRNSGFETLWLFDEKAIPSTKHMPCASIQKMGNTVVATIANACKDPSAVPQMMELAVLARAAAENRMHVAEYQAGSRVNVTFTYEVGCARAGSVSWDIQRATFHPAAHPGAPGLVLSKSKIGRNVATLIKDAMKWQYQKAECICNGCQGECVPATLAAGEVTRTLAGIELSKLAAYELLRHNTTAWYVS